MPIKVLSASFSTLLDIDKLTHKPAAIIRQYSFSILLDIDKLTPNALSLAASIGFSILLDIDKLTLLTIQILISLVLVLCWILINLHFSCLLADLE